jgi:hypothetical protein
VECVGAERRHQWDVAVDHADVAERRALTHHAQARRRGDRHITLRASYLFLGNIEHLFGTQDRILTDSFDRSPHHCKGHSYCNGVLLTLSNLDP